MSDLIVGDFTTCPIYRLFFVRPPPPQPRKQSSAPFHLSNANRVGEADVFLPSNDICTRGFALVGFPSGVFHPVSSDLSLLSSLYLAGASLEMHWPQCLPLLLEQERTFSDFWGNSAKYGASKDMLPSSKRPEVDIPGGQRPASAAEVPSRTPAGGAE